MPTSPPSPAERPAWSERATFAGSRIRKTAAVSCSFATPQAEGLRNAKAETESAFYDYLMDGLSESDRETFLNLLDVVYRRSKAESRAGFPHLKDVLKGKTNEPKA